jgi:hypothetical protein
MPNVPLISSLEDALRDYHTVKTSTYENPKAEEERISHQILGYQFIDTKKGILLLLKVCNPNTNEEYTLSYPDIINVERNTNVGLDSEKWYLYCLDRTDRHDLEKDWDKDWKITYRLTFQDFDPLNSNKVKSKII